MSTTQASLGFTIRPSGKNDRRVTFIASTADPDSHGTRLHPRGCQYADFLRNPTLLWNHATSRENCEPDDVIGRVVELSVTDDSVVAVVEFEGPENPKAETCYRKVLNGWLKSVSVGMIPLEQTAPDADGIVDILRWSLREISLVPVGSNGSALKVRGLGFTMKLPRRPVNVATVLVRRRSDRAMLWGRRNDSKLYTTPGGKFSDDELPEDAALRELAEEADVKTTREELVKLGVVDMGRALVHCFSVDVHDCIPSGAHDPDQEVTSWEWLQSPPPADQMHARPNALERWLPARTYSKDRGTTATEPGTRSPSKMNPEDVLAKLGLTPEAKPEDFAPALVKYLAGSDSDADKVAVVNALLAMLAPAAPAPASSGSQGGDAEARAVADAATMEEMRRLQSRVAELEDAAATKPAPKETPEQRADAAIRGGQWPLSQRAALVGQYVAGKEPYLHPAKTFTNRGLQMTVGGAAVAATKTEPNFGTDPGPAPSRADALAIELLKRQGVVVTPEQFAAAKAQA